MTDCYRPKTSCKPIMQSFQAFIYVIHSFYLPYLLISSVLHRYQVLFNREIYEQTEAKYAQVGRSMILFLVKKKSCKPIMQCFQAFIYVIHSFYLPYRQVHEYTVPISDCNFLANLSFTRPRLFFKRYPPKLLLNYVIKNPITLKVLSDSILLGGFVFK